MPLEALNVFELDWRSPVNVSCNDYLPLQKWRVIPDPLFVLAASSEVCLTGGRLLEGNSVGLVQVLEVEEERFELQEGDDAVLLDVVLVHDLVDVFLRNIAPNFVHGSNNVGLGDVAAAIGVEGLEDRLQLVVVHEAADVERRHQELGVVDLLVSKVVNLVDDLLDLLIVDLKIRLLDGGFQLLRVDQPRLVGVDNAELVHERLDLPLVSHLDHHSHSGSLQLALAAEVLKPVEDSLVNGV